MHSLKSAYATVLVATIAGSVPAVAAAGLYVGAGLVQSELEPRVNDSGFRVSDSAGQGAQVYIGWDINPRLSAEGYLADYGSAELSDTAGDTGEVGYRAVGFSGLLYLLGNQTEASRGLSVYLRGGFGVLENDSSDNLQVNLVENLHLAVGAGAEYRLMNQLSARVEYARLDTDAGAFTVSLNKRFGGGATRAEMPAPVTTSEMPETSITPAIDDALAADAADAADAAVAAEPEAPEVEPEASEAPALAAPAVAASSDSDGDGIDDDRDYCRDTAAGAQVAQNGCEFTGVISGVNFASNEATLTPSATAALDAAIVEYKANPELQLAIHAHTDNRGDAERNLELSRLRAATVVRYLVDLGGIDLGRFSAVGFGEGKPIQSNKTPEGRYANRRIEIVIVNR